MAVTWGPQMCEMYPNMLCSQQEDLTLPGDAGLQFWEAEAEFQGPPGYRMSSWLDRAI